MSSFEPAVDFLLSHEGGFVDDPDDQGGATNWGISLRYLKRQGDLRWDLDDDGDIDEDDIKLLTRAQAKGIYLVDWWRRYDYGLIDPQMIAEKVLDLAVNMGPRQAGRILQRALNALDYDADLKLAVDGWIGKQTRLAIVQSWPRRCEWDYRPRHDENVPAIVVGIRCEAASVYRQIIQRNPTMKKYERGWLRRAYA